MSAPASAASAPSDALLAVPTTANLTALVRAAQPVWRSAQAAALADAAGGVPIGQDTYAELALTPAQRQLLGDPATREDACRRVHAHIPGICAFVWRRTRCIDAALAQALLPPPERSAQRPSRPLQQLVVLGAGYDTRSYRFARALDAAGVRRFEVDLPALQQEKRAALAALAQRQPPAFRAAVAQVTFVPLDLARPKDELLAGMRAAGFDAQQVTLFVWEGVTAYLTAEAVRQSLEFMAAACAPGSTLLVTFVAQAPPAGRVRHELHRQKEPQQYFPSADEFSQVLEATGWQVTRIFTPAILASEFATEDEILAEEPSYGNVALAHRR